MSKVVEQFYGKLYEMKNVANEQSQKVLNQKITNANLEEIPAIEEDEISELVRKMKRIKAPGKDIIIPELIQEGGQKL